MAQQEGGWPLGLRPLNVRTGLIRNLDFSGSSFNTHVSGSPTSSTDSSSDLDTESTGSFFHDRSITLGSLIGITSILELSSRSLRSRRQGTVKGKKSHKTRAWFFLCAKSPVKSKSAGNVPSLGQFLEVERKASNAQRRNLISTTYELDGLPESQSAELETNSLFSNGYLNPPEIGGNEASFSSQATMESNAWVGSADRRPNGDLGHAGNYGIGLRFPCIGGELTN